MAKNCLRITHQRDTIQLSWQRGQAVPRFADVVEFEHPFDQQALTDLRWYLEEYLRFPYGLAPDNAAKIEQKLQNWGEQLFELVFRSSEKARRHLPFLGLFCERVNVDLLCLFSESSDNQYGQAYRAMFGENLQKNNWITILNEAAAASIVEHWGASYYKIHPALPWYLRQQLSKNLISRSQSGDWERSSRGSASSPLEAEPPGTHSLVEARNEENAMTDEEVINELEKKLLIFYAYLANNYHKKLISNAELATFILQVEEPNLLQNLCLAEQQQEWAYAQWILQPLAEIYERLGRKAEFKSLRQRALNQIGIHLAEAKAKGKDAFSFWMYLRVEDANEALLIPNLEEARVIYQEILDELTDLNDSSINYKIAVAYHQLGIVAQEQRKFEQARQYYLKALKIYEDAGDLYTAAREYHQLGNVAQEQREFEQARQYYLKALKILEDAGDLYSAANDYHQLGIVAQQQREFEQARQYSLKALKIYEDAGDLYSAASDYYELGIVAQQQREFEQARQYSSKALKIYEDAGDLYSAAGVYHQLGRVAEEQREFDVAINYYQKTFGICEQFRDWYWASQTLAKWGRVLEAQENYAEALPIYIHALAVDIEHNQDRIGYYINALARMLQQLRESQFLAIWREVTGEECAGGVREAIWAARDS